MALALPDQLRNQRMRDWARENGWPDLADRGRLPAAIEAAFEAYETATGGGSDGADFTTAAAAMGLSLEPGASPLDNDDDLPPDADGGGAAPPPPQGGATAAPDPGGATAALPPVTNLAEARERVAASRAAPAWARPPGGGKGRQDEAATGQGKGRRRASKPAPPPPGPEPIAVTPQVIDDMTGKLATLLMTPAHWWEKADPVCGGAFVDQGTNIIEAWVPVMARSQAVVRMFMVDQLWFQLFAAVSATWPLLETIYDHHFSEEAHQRKTAERDQAAAQQTGDDDLGMYPSAPVVGGHTPPYRAPQARM